MWRTDDEIGYIFQFLIGAIKSAKEERTRPTTSNFNSLLVRLKEGKNWDENQIVMISIPYWCD